jgi:hypothetical protein
VLPSDPFAAVSTTVPWTKSAFIPPDQRVGPVRVPKVRQARRTVTVRNHRVFQAPRPAYPRGPAHPELAQGE